MRKRRHHSERLVDVGIIQRMDCARRGSVGRVQRVEGEWKLGSDKGQAEPWGVQ